MLCWNGSFKKNRIERRVRGIWGKGRLLKRPAREEGVRVIGGKGKFPRMRCVIMSECV